MLRSPGPCASHITPVASFSVISLTPPTHLAYDPRGIFRKHVSGHVVFLLKILKMTSTGVFVLSGCHDRTPQVGGLRAAESSGGRMCTIKAPAASASGEGLDSRSVHGRLSVCPDSLEGRGATWGLFYKGSDPICGGSTLMTSANPNHLPKAPPPDAIGG